MSIVITGVAGFIGCNLARVLVQQGITVLGVDNLCRGQRHHLDPLQQEPRFTFAHVDMADRAAYGKIVADFHKMAPVTEIWHLAANSDIPAGVASTAVDFRDTFMTTFNTLEIMKSHGIRVLLFASSSAIYGDWGDRPLVEDMGPLLPVSNYGAMKLASEAIISAAAETFLKQVYIFRFPNVIGIPATHGVILDFIRKLKANPSCLTVLGNGSQQKGYLHVCDLIDAMLHIRAYDTSKRAVFNIGAGDTGVTVRFIAEETVRQVAPEARIQYGSEPRGWIGDVPRFQFSVDKLKRLGWSPALGSRAAVERAIGEIVGQEGALP